MQLTNADRRILLDSFRGLARDWSGDNAELINWTTRWVASISPTFGYEDGLSRDVIFLADQLRYAEAGSEIARLAAGALAYLHQGNQVDSAASPLGLLDDAFVAGYAAFAVREKSGITASYQPPGLRADEQAVAEAMFDDFMNRPESEDGALPARAEASLAGLGHLVGSGLFRRLHVNVSLLSQVLGDTGRPAEHRKVARAALHYVAEENDAIPNSLGPIGYLDDYFIAELAVGLIDDSRAPWMDLIDALVGAWPFLNMVAFGNGDRGFPLSEFQMVNAAMTCPALRGPSGGSLTHIVLPTTGPLPLLLGFFASLGELGAARKRGGTSVSFEIGQKVLLDGKAYTFEGCQLIQGQMRFGVGKTRTERGQPLRSIQWLHIDQLGRLVPASSGRSVRGRLAVADLGQQPLNTLDYLFLSADAVVVPPDLPQVVVVTPAGASRDLSEAITLFGQRLCDALPMGHLTPSGDVVPWSARFGATRPAVLVAPDLDRACEYVEECGDTVTMTVVDASGHNAGRLASLNRLLTIGGRILVAVPEAEADDVVEGVADPAVWEWTPADYTSLCVGAGTNGYSDPVRSYEREVVRAASAGVEVVRVEAAGVEEAHRSLTALRRLAEARDEDVPKELEDALGRSWSAFCRLIRCPFRLCSHPELEADLKATIDAILVSEDAANFLSPEETRAIHEMQGSLRTLLAGLHDRNPKEDALAGLRDRHPHLSVVCGDVPLLQRTDEMRVVEVASALDQPEDLRESGHAVSGWFGQGTMKRLLRPPFATPLYLVLCGPELAWHEGFRRRVRASSSARSGRASRQRFFPGLGRWPEPPDTRAGGEPAPADVEAPEAIETFLVRERRRRLVGQARPSQGEESVQARLVTFDGGHAFLTDDYRAKVATHLVTGQAEGQEAALRLLPSTDLRKGDLLLFLRGSNSDVIRQVADKSLPGGERERAALWRRTLLNYRSEGSRSIEDVWKGLRDKGCPLRLATIEHWFADEEMISPANIDRELKSILELTQNPEFQNGLEGCRASIRRVRGEHLKASREIARRVVERAVAVLMASAQGAGPIDLGEGIVLARVTEIDRDAVAVKRSAANRLLEEQS